LGIPVAVRGGGHNVAGRAVCDDGMTIDLTLMRSVVVDPTTSTAVAEGGATWGEFNDATQRHGLATTGGVVSSTGVGGLTLGGGIGWLMGRYGLAIDNLVSVELVLADGRIVVVSERNHPDLFWGVRGGGGNFGVATRFTFRLHPVSEVIGGIVAHPLDRGSDMLRFYRGAVEGAPDSLTLFAGLMHAPDGSGHKIGAMVACHADGASGMADVAAVKGWGPPILDLMGPMPYQAVNAMLDNGFPRGALNYWKSGFMRELPDEAIDTMVAMFRECPAPLGGLLLERFHGVVTRVSATATAFPHRQAGYNLLILSQWMDPADNDRCKAWARDTYQAMAKHMSGGRYVNYLGDDEPSESVTAASGPHNIFRLNQNVAPAV
jgi:hypothetical protein